MANPDTAADLERLKSKLIYGVPPAAAQAGPPAVAGPREEGLFDPDAADGGLESLPTGAQKHPMPGDRWVWVHPITPDEALYLSARALQEVEAIKPTPEP